MLDNDKAVILKALEDYINSQGIDPDELNDNELIELIQMITEGMKV